MFYDSGPQLVESHHLEWGKHLIWSKTMVKMILKIIVWSHQVNTQIAEMAPRFLLKTSLTVPLDIVIFCSLFFLGWHERQTSDRRCGTAETLMLDWFVSAWSDPGAADWWPAVQSLADGGQQQTQTHHQCLHGPGALAGRHVEAWDWWAHSLTSFHLKKHI